jgi:hypothetical protein
MGGAVAERDERNSGKRPRQRGKRVAVAPVSPGVSPIDIARFVSPSSTRIQTVDPIQRLLRDLGQNWAAAVHSQIDWANLLPRPVDATQGLGLTVDWAEVLRPKIAWAEALAPKIDLSQVLDTQALSGDRLAEQRDYLRAAITPNISYRDVLAPSLSLGKVLAAAWAGSDADAHARPPIAVTDIFGDMTIADVLGDIEVPDVVDPSAKVTDLIGGEVAAGDLVGETRTAPPETNASEYEHLNASEAELLRALGARFDALEGRVGIFRRRLGNIESKLGFRAQTITLLVNVIVGLAVTALVAHVSPELTNPQPDQPPTKTEIMIVQPPVQTPPAKALPGTARGQQIKDINSFLQGELKRRRLPEVSAVEAARWLDTAQLLIDSASRPGAPLRRLVRAGDIRGSEQRPNQPHGRWYIVRL